MPKLNRKQRFAVLKNIFDELGEKSVMRQAARLQIPAEEARALLEEWKGGKPAVIDEAPEAEEAPAPRKVRPVTAEKVERVVRQPARVQRPVTAARVVRTVTAKPAKPEVRIPPEKEEGVIVDGYKDCELRKGSHVRHIKGESIGVILGIGPQQCEVKWFNTGAVQAEITKQLRKAK